MIKNYRTISLLPIFSKILKRLIFNSMFNFFRQNNIFTKRQSGFIPGDSCVTQLLSITHEIYQSFDCSLTRDVKRVFFDISKAFHKIWHEGLLFKLQSYGVESLFSITPIYYVPNFSLSPLKINWKWFNIIQHLLLLVHLKVHRATLFTESSV